MGVGGITNATTVALSISPYTSNACALLENKTIKCWGYNNWGQLGNGKVSESFERFPPVQVGEISNAVAITAGTLDACAVLANGGMDCWGNDKNGQLGNGVFSTNPYSTPVSVEKMTNAIGTAAGNYQTCALLSSGGIDCWGYNNDGRLGNGTKEESSTPVPVSGIG